MKQGSVRIIGGIWRSRRIKVPLEKGLRPTPDRVRETVFNWLTPYIEGAYCLDAFAGSGVLGFEALSRGAAFVSMTDNQRAIINHLKETKTTLGAAGADIYQASAPTQLHRPAKPFDIVFLDPPYRENILLPCCHYLEEQQFLAPSAYIYLEAAQAIKDNELPTHWRLQKSAKAGDVFYHLAHREI